MPTGPPAVVVEASFRPDALASYLVTSWHRAGSPGDLYLYDDMTNVADYVVQPGDFLEYDFRWPDNGFNDAVALDLRFSDGTYFGVAGGPPLDIFLDPIHASTDMRGRFGASVGGWYPWYHRQIPLRPPYVGKTIQKWLLANERDGVGSEDYDVRFRDILITDGAGQVRAVVWAQGDAPPSLFVDKQNPAGSTLAVSRVDEPRIWANLSPRVLGLTPQRGRQEERGQTEAGSMALKVDDDDRRFDPSNAAGEYFPYLDNGAPVRVRAFYPANLVADASFESGLIPDVGTLVADAAGRFANDKGWYGVKTGTAVVSDVFAGALFGSWRGDVTLSTPGDTGKIVSDFIAVDEAKAYVLSLNIEKVSGTGNPQVNLTVEFFDGLGASLGTLAGTALAAVTGLTALTANLNPTGAWVRYGGLLSPSQIPAETSHIQLTLACSFLTSGSSTGFEGVQLEAGTAVTPFADPTISGLHRGEIQRLPPTYDNRHTTIDIECSDGTERLSRGTIPAKFYAQAQSGDQVDAILDDTGWSERRSIETGSALVQSWTSDEDSGVERIQELADAELGLFFIDGDGRAVFQGRSHRITPPNNISKGTFSTKPGSGEYQALVPQPSRDADRVLNHIARRPSGGVTWYTADDVVSRRKYGPRSDASEPVVVTTSEALNQALLLLSRYAYPLLRFDGITLDPVRSMRARALGSAEADLWTQVLQREVSDRVTVEVFVPGGSVYTKDVYIESIAHSISIDRGEGHLSWTTVWSLSPADEQNYWILGDAVNGLLGLTTRIGY